uniref:Uncharacterized protein n=1 Tax=Cacopsylla melanoneura TaxID=428564 RepID=A0A8D8WCC9_9HEMI
MFLLSGKYSLTANKSFVRQDQDAVEFRSYTTYTFQAVILLPLFSSLANGSLLCMLMCTVNVFCLYIVMCTVNVYCLHSNVYCQCVLSIHSNVYCQCVLST